MNQRHFPVQRPDDIAPGPQRVINRSRVPLRPRRVPREEGGHRYFMEYRSAGRRVKDGDVQVGGRRFGSIRAIENLDNPHVKPRP